MKTDAEQCLREFITIYNEEAIINDRETRCMQYDELRPDIRENWLETFRILLQRIEGWNRE